MNNQELAKVKARIRALSAKTLENGCTENEAMVAAQMVGMLLEQYNLSMAEIDIRAEPTKQFEYKYAKADRSLPMDNCLMSIAKFCNVRIWLNSTWLQRGSRMISGKSGFTVFGLESDVEMAVYLYNMIDGAVKFELTRYKRTAEYASAPSKKAAQVSFQHGMVSRVARRLRQMAGENAAKQRAQQAASNGRDLIVVKNDLIESEMAKLGVVLTTKKSYQRSTDSRSYANGAARGETVNLNRPIGAGNGSIAGLIGR